jgi:mitogen-activated protein kinase kinase kinase 4
LRAKLAKQLTTFAGQWITFVRTRCEKGRGLRARWVYPGLQYLIVALEPQYIQVLNDREFQHLKEEVDHVLTHLLGSTDRSPKLLLPLPQNYQGPYPVLSAETINKPLASSLNFQRSQSVVNVKGMFGDLNFLDQRQSNESHEQKGTRLEDWMSKKHHTSSNLPIILHRKRPQSSRMTSTHSMQQVTALVDAKPMLNTSGSIVDVATGNGADPLNVFNSNPKSIRDLHENESIKLDDSRSSDQSTSNRCKLESVKSAIRSLDDGRDSRLKERGMIGSVSDLVIQRASLQIAARKVNFPWQRGFKIGEGRFGKVYTAVNNSTGELIAMKEIHLQQANDSRAIKETIDEIRIFEGIKHPNIVKYFGVEIHRDELYIFMEYCNEGSLENAVQLNLPEQLVRKYTRQLLEAVNCLHEHGIVHRDIKSANIFLTSDGNLKLGDFGCCMKLKNHSTMPGELCTLVGTPAYMAPEMFTRNSIEGHGRSSDIWSIGCVVLEMLSGRRPWHDLENSYQIMFKVGMGETPEVPDEICTEGKSFISHCLRQDPRLRWSTGQLLCHPFTKVLEDDYI